MIKNNILNEDMKYVAEGIGNLEKFRNKNILVTGCAGFLGFYFVNFFDCLLKNGIPVKSLQLIDNFILGEPRWLKEIKREAKKIEVYPFDIAKDDLKRIRGIRNADFVIHMASIASPSFYRKYPLQTIDANIWGLRKLLEFYKNSSMEGMLFFSSSEIYGDPLPLFIPTKENYKGNVSCVGPRACYDESKRFGETLCYSYANIYKMPIIVVRPFNNYGPGMNLNDKRVPADFAKAVIEKNNIVIYSQGTPTRTFCYVADALAGYLLALTYGKYDYFNIGIDKPEISIRELAEIYKEAGRKIFNYKGKILFKKHKEKKYLTDNPSRRCPDISKARELLKFNPRISVREGVERFLKFLQTEVKK